MEQSCCLPDGRETAPARGCRVWHVPPHTQRYGHVRRKVVGERGTSAAQGGDMSIERKKKGAKRGEDEDNVFIYLKKRLLLSPCYSLIKPPR